MDHIIMLDAHAKLQPSFIAKLKNLGKVFKKNELDEATLREIEKTATVLVGSGGSKFPREYLMKMPALKLVSIFGVGYDGVDVKAAGELGIKVTHTPDVMKDDVADTAVALLLNSVREFVADHRAVEENRWRERSGILTRSVSHMKVGIAGMGRIGVEIARRLEGFKCDIRYFSRHKKNVTYEYMDSILSLASWAEALILILPGSSETYHMVDEKVLNALGQNGYLINVARGRIVDETALIKAVKEHRIAGAGLDVFEKEPCHPVELSGLPNVMLLPHVGSATRDTREAMGDMVCENVRCFLNGEEVPNLVPELR